MLPSGDARQGCAVKLAEPFHLGSARTRPLMRRPAVAGGSDLVTEGASLVRRRVGLMLCNHDVLCRVEALRTAGLHLCSWARALSQIPRGRLGRWHVLPSGPLGGGEGTSPVHPSGRGGREAPTYPFRSRPFRRRCRRCPCQGVPHRNPDPPGRDLSMNGLGLADQPLPVPPRCRMPCSQ